MLNRESNRVKTNIRTATKTKTKKLSYQSFIKHYGDHNTKLSDSDSLMI